MWGSKSFKHKLQLVLHFAVFLYYMYGDLVMVTVFNKIHDVLGKAADDPEILRYIAASPGFFTLWNTVLHQVYFGACCLSHLSDGFPALVPAVIMQIANYVRNGILNSILIPSSIMTAVNYWGMRALSPEGVYDNFLAAYPEWVNHSLHTFVVPVALLELYLRASSGEAKDFGSRRGWVIVNGYVTLYTAATAAHYLSTGTWIYPFYDPMKNWMRAGVTFFVYGSAWLYYLAAIRLAKTYWGRPIVTKRTHHLKPKRK